MIHKPSMINWDMDAVSEFLGVTPTRTVRSSPIQEPYPIFSFSLPFARDVVELHVLPDSGFCQVMQNREAGAGEFLSAYIACDSIRVYYDLPEEGGDCIVLDGKAGHVCISKSADGFEFFFSMHVMPSTNGRLI